MTPEERERLAIAAANYWADEYQKLKKKHSGWRRAWDSFVDGFFMAVGVAVVIVVAGVLNR